MFSGLSRLISTYASLLVNSNFGVIVVVDVLNVVVVVIVVVDVVFGVVVDIVVVFSSTAFVDK